MNRIVLLGDSITAGVTDGYPSAIFSHKLQNYFPETEFINRGVPGDITRNALDRLQADVLEVDPTLVTIFFGTNDVADEQTSLSDYTNNLKKICQTIGTKKCILITPGVAGPSHQDHRPDKQMAAYAKATFDLAQRLDIPCLNWHKIMLANVPAQLLQVDELHYSALAYDLLTKNLRDIIRTRLADITKNNITLNF